MGLGPSLALSSPPSIPLQPADAAILTRYWTSRVRSLPWANGQVEADAMLLRSFLHLIMQAPLPIVTLAARMCEIELRE